MFFSFDPFSWLLLLFIGFLLFVFAYSLFSFQTKKNYIKRKKEEKTANQCPVCNSFLKKSEQLVSALYPGKTDRLCYIYGCPHCYPSRKSGISRLCPVCGKAITPEGFVIARLFSRSKKEKHVHIVGCTFCRFKK